jgi:hypothetical protein
VKMHAIDCFQREHDCEMSCTDGDERNLNGSLCGRRHKTAHKCNPHLCYQYPVESGCCVVSFALFLLRVG